MNGLATRFDDWSDRVSPIVVKEVRQMVRGREFIYSFGISLLAGLLVAFFGLLGSVEMTGVLGGQIFTALMVCLSLLGVVVVPLGAFNALRVERSDHTFDLIIQTALTPRQIVIGKLLTQGVKLIALFAGLAPFVAMSFLLGGIDLLTILTSLAALFLGSLWCCSTCLFVSSAFKSRVAAAGLIVVGFFIFFGFAARLPYFLRPLFSSTFSTAAPPSFGWWLLGGTTIFGLISMGNMVLLAENRLSLPIEDRSTALRAGFFVQFLFLLICSVAPAYSSSLASSGYTTTDLVSTLGVLGGIHLAIAATFAITEDLVPSRRVLRTIEKARRRPQAIFRPGSGRGVGWIWAQMIVMLVLAAAFRPDTKDLAWLLALYSLILFFTGVPAFGIRAALRGRTRSVHLRVGILMFLPVIEIFVELFQYYFVPRALGTDYLAIQGLNPFKTLANWDAVLRLGFQYRIFGLGLIGFLCYLAIVLQAHKEENVPSPPIDWPAVHGVAGAFRLAMPRSPAGGRLGERMGSGAGSSLEFQDYRQYTAGDDLRHVDWPAYARSGTLTVRLYREEVAPRIDLILDASRSMLVTERKAIAYGELSGLLACTSASTEIDVRVVTAASTEPRPFARPEEIERLLQCDAKFSVFEESRMALRRRSLRVVVSDFLFPHDPDILVGRLAREGASLAIVQLTLPEEVEPPIEGAMRLVDAEGHGEIDLVIDEKVATDYRERFGRLRVGLMRAARRAGASYAHVIAGTPLREVARNLVSAGMLESS